MEKFSMENGLRRATHLFASLNFLCSQAGESLSCLRVAAGGGGGGCFVRSTRFANGSVEGVKWNWVG